VQAGLLGECVRRRALGSPSHSISARDSIAQDGIAFENGKTTSYRIPTPHARELLPMNSLGMSQDYARSQLTQESIESDGETISATGLAVTCEILGTIKNNLIRAPRRGV
jgi:hypothetical protein